jgi:hypothetical protein
VTIQPKEAADIVAKAKRVAEEAEKLLHSLGEYVRQSMHENPEWRDGVVSLREAILDFRRLVPAEPPRTAFDPPRVSMSPICLDHGCPHFGGKCPHATHHFPT